MAPNDSPKGANPLFHKMLRWYDKNHRNLDWRVAPAQRRRGERPDPYRVWLSEVMLCQTNVTTVAPYFRAFMARWPDVHSLAAAPREAVLAAWAGLGYYARARNLHACAQLIVQNYHGRFPATIAELRALPGIGAYCAAAIGAIALDLAVLPVDGNIERILARFFRVETPLPQAKKEIAVLASELRLGERSGDFAQSLMDLGAMICTPRAPRCGLCPLRSECLVAGTAQAEAYPRRAPKRPVATRKGRCGVLLSGSHVLCHRRADRGLLGGMWGLPGDDWDRKASPSAPVPGSGPRASTIWDPRQELGDLEWREAGEIQHVFTHFALRMHVDVAQIADDIALRQNWLDRLAGAAPDSQHPDWHHADWQWFDMEAGAMEPLPTLMRKAVEAALQSRD